MRRTGKLYTLTLVSVALSIISSIYIALWDFDTSQFHLWFDVVPSGFGIASFITSMLIVSLGGHQTVSLSHLWYDHRR
jgi:hypothetical protein